MAGEHDNDLVAVNDFETGGLSEQNCSILAYGVSIVDPRTLEVLRSDEFKVVPDFPVNAGAAAVNGYTPEGWVGALSQREGIERYRDFISGVRQFGSWNTWFDRRFLAATSARTQVPIDLDYHCIDLVGIAREKLWTRGVRLEKVSLDKVSVALGLPTEPLPHLPLRGVEQALMVWRKLREF